MRFKKFTMLLLTLLCLGLFSPNIFGATSYTPVTGDEFTFYKYLIIDQGETIPTATFSFTIEPGTPISLDTSNNTVMEVLAGIGTPTVTTVSFNSSDSTVNSVTTGDIDVARSASNRATGLNATTGVELGSGEKYAKKAVTINFSNVSFSEPGIYRYILTETSSTANTALGIMNDNDVDRVLDVYVINNGSGSLVVDSYVLHINVDDVAINGTMGSNDVATNHAALPDKTDGFTNEYHSKDLVVKKEVDGNQASRDKWFDFTVQVTGEGIQDTNSYIVSIADDNDATTTVGNADATSGNNTATIENNRGKTNPTSVLGSELKSGVHFYLQHDQSIAIRGLSPNTTYTVTENAEDYKSIASGVSGYTAATIGSVGTVAGANKVIQTSYKNQRNGIIPTGIATHMILGIVVMILAVVIIFGVYLKYRNKKELES